MLLKPNIPVHPLGEGKSNFSPSYTTAMLGSSPRGGEIYLFSSKSFKTNFSKLPVRQWIKIINTKINFSKLPVRQSSNHRAGLAWRQFCACAFGGSGYASD